MFNFSRSVKILMIEISFIFGVVTASFLPREFTGFSLAFFTLAVAALSISLIFHHNGRIAFVAAVFALFFFGFWRLGLVVTDAGTDMISRYNGKEVNFSGIISDEPDERGKITRLTLGTIKLASGAELRGKVLATVDPYPKYRYGDRLRVACLLEAPAAVDEFAYDRYLARFGIYSLCAWPEIKLLAPAGGISVSNRLFSGLYRFKETWRRVINSGLDEPEAGLARGMLLGDQKALDTELSDAFKRTGLTHIVAISGMNITILAGLSLALFLVLGFWRRQAFYFAAATLLIYLALIGFPASAVRAGVMGFLVLWAAYLGRLSRMIPALVLAAALMLLYNPLLARDDVGFQLSFLAALGLSIYYEPLERLFIRLGWRKFSVGRQSLALTLAAQALTLPVLIYNFSAISPVSPLANLLTVWTLPAIMIAVLAGSALSLALPFGAPLLFLPARLLLSILISAAKLCARLPLAYREMQLSFFVLAIYYFLLIWLAIRLNRPKAERTYF